METPTRRTVTIHGHELSYLDSGTGSVVLFIHGILGSQRQWTHLIDRLHDDHRVIVPDLFGHGESDKPVGDYSLGAHAATLRDLLDRLGIERVTLVGHSLGGGIAMEFYYLFPERVERLVLVASGGLGREVNPILRSATLPGAEWVLPVLASGWVRARAEGAGRALSRAGWKPGTDITAIWEGFTSLGDAASRRAPPTATYGIAIAIWRHRLASRDISRGPRRCHDSACPHSSHPSVSASTTRSRNRPPRAHRREVTLELFAKELF